MRFKSDGSSVIYSADFGLCADGVYGVNEAGTAMTTNFRSLYHNAYEVVGNDDGCIVFKWYDINATNGDDAELYYLCKQDKDTPLVCY